MGRKRRSGCLGKVLFGGLLAIVIGAGVFYYVNPSGFEEIMEPCQKIGEDNTSFEENTIQEEELQWAFYYQQLPENEKAVYKELYQGMQSNEEQIYVHSGDSERTGDIYQYVLHDHPELFWCDGSATTLTYEDYIIFTPNYTFSETEQAEKQEQIDQAVEACLAGAPGEGSAYDKIKYIYEYLVNQTDYQLDSPDSQNICSVFINKVSVCAGYAKANQYLLSKLGIECIYVVGSAQSQEAHAWNIVNIDGVYYHVDPTWGDPVFLMQEDHVENISNISYDYLCCDDATAGKTHFWDSNLNLPACTSDAYNYYKLNNCYYEFYDEEAILKAMNETIAAGGSQTTFKFASDEAYQQAKEPLIADLAEQAMQSLMSMYGLETVTCGQMVDDSEDKIIIYWNYN